MQTTGTLIEEAKTPEVKLAAPSVQETKSEAVVEPITALAALQSDVQPVGHDYVEEVILLWPAY